MRKDCESRSKTEEDNTWVFFDQCVNFAKKLMSAGKTEEEIIQALQDSENVSLPFAEYIYSGIAVPPTKSHIKVTYK